MGRTPIIAGIAAVAAVALALYGAGGSRPDAPVGARAEKTAAGETPPRMLELYTPWCPSCSSMKPVVEELAARCAEAGVDIQAVDVSREENERIADRYGVRAVPTFLFLDANGAEAKRLVGAQTAKDLQVGLEALGGISCGAPVPTDRLAPSVEKEG